MGLLDSLFASSNDRMRDDIRAKNWNKVIRRIYESAPDEFNWIIGEDGAYQSSEDGDSIWIWPPAEVVLALWRKASLLAKCDMLQKHLDRLCDDIAYEKFGGYDRDDMILDCWAELSATSQETIIRYIKGHPGRMYDFVQRSGDLSEDVYRKVLEEYFEDEDFKNYHIHIPTSCFCFLWDKIQDKPFVPSWWFVGLIEGDVADDVLMSIDTKSYEHEIFLKAIASNNVKVYKKMVEIKEMNPLEETSCGYNALAMAAHLGDIELFKWILTFPGAKELFVPSQYFIRFIEEDVADDVLMSINTKSYEHEIFLKAIASNNVKVYKKMVMIKQMNPLEETTYGYNAVMMAAHLGDIELFKWILTFPGAKILLGHKTYRGEMYTDFAEKAKRGAFLNYIRDNGFAVKKEEKNQKVFNPKPFRQRTAQHQHQVVNINMQYPQSTIQKNGSKPHSQIMQKSQKNLQADLNNPKTVLHQTLRKMGYFDNPSKNLQADMKNPTSPVYKLIRKLGYSV